MSQDMLFCILIMYFMSYVLMSIEEKKSDTPEGNDLMALIWKYAKTTTLGNVIAWFAIIVLVLQLSWLSVGTIVDKRFGIKETQMTQAYELQVRQIELTENEIIPRLDDILKRVMNVENRVLNLEWRVSDHDRRLEQLEKKWDNLIYKNR